MSKTRIEFDYDGKHYRLEFTAASLKRMEREGVKLAKLDDMVVSAPETLFRGAFYANHPTVNAKKTHEIYQALKRTAEDTEPELDENGRETDALNDALAQMLSEAVDELNGRGERGNVSWTVTR